MRNRIERKGELYIENEERVWRAMEMAIEI